MNLFILGKEEQCEPHMLRFQIPGSDRDCGAAELMLTLQHSAFNLPFTPRAVVLYIFKFLYVWDVFPHFSFYGIYAMTILA